MPVTPVSLASSWRMFNSLYLVCIFGPLLRSHVSLLALYSRLL